MIKEQSVYGIHSVLEALESGRLLDKIYLRKSLISDATKKIRRMAREQCIPVQEVPVEKLNRMTSKAHQGCIAVVAPIEYTQLEQLIPVLYENGEEPFIVVLDGLTDTRNFGAIARSAECAGAHALIIPSHGSVSVTADAVNASAGALMHIPVCRVTHLAKALAFLSMSGIRIAIADEKANEKYFEANLSGPIAIVVGNEHDGVSKPVREEGSLQISIPLKGAIGSLNVSVAAGILLFDVARRRLNSVNDYNPNLK